MMNNDGTETDRSVSSISPFSSSPAAGCLQIETNQGPAWVLDDAMPESVLAWLDGFRLSLPLDAKRPTVDRRFFSDNDQASRFAPTKRGPSNAAATYNLATAKSERPISSLLENVLHRRITNQEQQTNEGSPNDETHQQNWPLSFHVFCYQRFLEYTKKNSSLSPHSDGTKVCDETKQRSTHTLLLYLTDCFKGGETMLLRKVADNSWPTPTLEPSSEGGQDRQYDGDANLIYATKPKRGRILIFPHATPHAGGAVVSVPKICLRAEVAVSCMIDKQY